MVRPAEQRQHRVEIGAQGDHGVGEEPVPQGGRERERHEGAGGREAREARERHHDPAPHREQPRQEDAVAAVALVLPFDVPDGALGEQSSAEPAAERGPAVAPRQEIHRGPRADVRGPGDAEDGPGIEEPPPRQKRPQRDGGVGRQGGNDVLQAGEGGDGSIEQTGRKRFQERDELGHPSTATAITAIPSPFPIHPIPSFVFAFTDTWAGADRSASASFSSIRSTCGPSFGRSAMIVMSACTNWCPASTTFRNAWFRSWSESAFFQRGSVLGNRRPMSPSPAAPSRASVSAWATASASEWPASPCGWGISTPPRISLRPSAKRWESYPMPTRTGQALRIRIARSAAFLALSIPTVATGVPPGTCAVASSASRPFSGPTAKGTPITGRSVSEAAYPGSAAESPAPAITTRKPLPRASFTSCAVWSGWRCAEETWNAYETPALLSTSQAGSIRGLSDSEPTRIRTSGTSGGLLNDRVVLAPRLGGVARVGDEAAHLGQGHPPGRARGGDHVLLHHQGAEVVRAEAQRDLADLRAHRHPGGLDVGDVV